MTMNATLDRLQQGAATLDALQRRRKETKSPLFGTDTEYAIIDRELRELEADIASDPGALEAYLVRPRRAKTEPRK
jgi:hypothetical protein